MTRASSGYQHIPDGETRVTAHIEDQPFCIRNSSQSRQHFVLGHGVKIDVSEAPFEDFVGVWRTAGRRWYRLENDRTGTGVILENHFQSIFSVSAQQGIYQIAP
jgi:hypothetical protein